MRTCVTDGSEATADLKIDKEAKRKHSEEDAGLEFTWKVKDGAPFLKLDMNTYGRAASEKV